MRQFFFMGDAYPKKVIRIWIIYHRPFMVSYHVVILWTWTFANILHFTLGLSDEYIHIFIHSGPQITWIEHMKTSNCFWFFSGRITTGNHHCSASDILYFLLRFFPSIFVSWISTISIFPRIEALLNNGLMIWALLCLYILVTENHLMAIKMAILLWSRMTDVLSFEGLFFTILLGRYFISFHHTIPSPHWRCILYFIFYGIFAIHIDWGNPWAIILKGNRHYFFNKFM